MNKYSNLFTYLDFISLSTFPTNTPPLNNSFTNPPITLDSITVLNNRDSIISLNTNTTPSTTILQAGGNVVVGALGSIAPQLGQTGGSILSLTTEPIKQYSTTPFKNLQSIPGLPYLDFRARRGLDIRLDGTSAALRGSKTARVYAAASLLFGGAYTAFNLDATYGWGTHGDPSALRKDFTRQSQVGTQWDAGIRGWVRTKNLLSIVTPFRGDKVNVIDFGKRTFKKIYQWKTSRELGPAALNELASKLGNDTTKDFIKFYFTGPKILANGEGEDDVIVFRATLSSLYDSFNASITPQQLIGRGDKNYTYGGFDRNMSLDFTVIATDRDEMKPIWRKLNYLASYTTPEYDLNTPALKAPWLRLTIGDLLVQQPIILQNINYTLVDGDTTWEINIEDDPEMMQAPHKVTVSLGFIVLTDYLPQKRGNMYTLAKSFDENGVPIGGNDNWLSDSESTYLVRRKRSKF